MADYWDLPSATLIIQEYEKAAAKDMSRNKNKTGAWIQFKSGLAAMETTVKFSKEMLVHSAPIDDPTNEEEMQLGTSSYAMETSEESSAENNSEETDPNLLYEDTEGAWTGTNRKIPRPVSACDKETESHSAGAIFDTDKDFIGFNPEDTTIPGVAIDRDLNWAKTLGISDKKLEELKEEWGEDYLQKCLNCDPSMNFNWQVQPFNFFKSIEDLLQQIENIIDSAAARIKSGREWVKKLFCMLWGPDTPEFELKLGDLICPTNWITILAAIQGLLAKYRINMISLKLDWTAIVGPILSALVDAITSLLESIYALVMPPIDCLINAVSVMNQVIKEAGNTVNSAYNTAHSLGTGRNPFLFGLNESKVGGNYSWTPEQKRAKGESLWNSKEINSLKKTGNWSDTFVPTFGASKGKDKADKSVQLEDTGKNVSFWTGIELGGGETTPLEEKKFQVADWQGMKPLEIILKDFKAWIRKLFDNLKNLVNSLKRFFTGNMGATFAMSGAALFLIDIASFITEVVMVSRADSMNSYCTDDEDSEEEDMEMGTSQQQLAANREMELSEAVSKLAKALSSTPDESENSFTIASKSGLFDIEISKNPCTNTSPHDNNAISIDKIFEAMSFGNGVREREWGV